MSRTQELAVILLLVEGGVCSLVRSCEQFIRSSVSIERTITCFLIFKFAEHIHKRPVSALSCRYFNPAG